MEMTNQYFSFFRTKVINRVNVWRLIKCQNKQFQSSHQNKNFMDKMNLELWFYKNNNFQRNLNKQIKFWRKNYIKKDKRLARKLHQYLDQVRSLYLFLILVIDHFQNHLHFMCDFIDGTCFIQLSSQQKTQPQRQNTQKTNHKILFQDSIFNFKFRQQSSFNIDSFRAVCLIKEVHSNVDLYLELFFQNSELLIKAKTIMNFCLVPVRSKQMRKILIKQLSKRSFLTMIEPYKLLIQMQTGELFLTTPLYRHQTNSKQFHKKIVSVIDCLIKKIIETLSYIQKLIKLDPSQFSESKRQKMNQLFRYFFRCTTAPSLSIRSDCAQYQSLMNRYAASRCDLDDLFRQHQEGLDISRQYFKSIKIYGFDIVADHKLDYLSEISLMQKEKIQQEISIPSFAISKPKQNKYIFNHCYFYNNVYQQRKIAEGGNSQVYVVKPQVYEYSSTGGDVDHAIQKQIDISRYIQKHLVYKKPIDERKFKDELIHRQSEIVSYFRGGSCLFLPKYYLNVDKQSPYNSILFADYLNGDSLDKFLSYNSQTVSMYTKVYLSLQILQGLRFINSFGVVHLDIKEANIIILRRMICKLVDFGESFNYKVCGDKHKPKYTRIYASPEVATSIKGRLFTEKSDIFSFGIMMHNILFGRYPYFFSDQRTFEKHNFEGNLRQKTFYLPEEIEEYGNRVLLGLMYQLILRCIDMKEPKRPYLDWVTVIIKCCFNLFTSQ